MGTPETTSELAISPAPPPPLFTLDLGANGGVLAPTSSKELLDWIQAERDFWMWVTTVATGSHRNTIDQMMQMLHNAYTQTERAIQYQNSSSENPQKLIDRARQDLDKFYGKHGFPHSSTWLANRVYLMSVQDKAAALAYLYVSLPNQGSYQFDARDISSWRGFIEALVEKYGICLAPEGSNQAALATLEGLSTKAERLVSESTIALAELKRGYLEAHSAITNTGKLQEDSFREFLDESQTKHNDTLNAHQNAINHLEQTFREKMTLRAPVEYWESRQTHHSIRTKWLGWATFGSMGFLSTSIGGIAYWVLRNLGADGKPDAWRVAVLALVGVLGVWAVRLVVRIFLSHIHLATDASERVTMVKTYLSLLEGDKLPSDEDRKLILQALFRPGSDGIVKDEGLPHPALEFLTKMGRS